jgi:hypothetical protein
MPFLNSVLKLFFSIHFCLGILHFLKMLTNHCNLMFSMPLMLCSIYSIPYCCCAIPIVQQILYIALLLCNVCSLYSMPHCCCAMYSMYSMPQCCFVMCAECSVCHVSLPIPGCGMSQLIGYTGRTMAPLIQVATSNERSQLTPCTHYTHNGTVSLSFSSVCINFV